MPNQIRHQLSEEFHTYSIVARDQASGQMGVAVQSHAFGVGRMVTWSEAGVGAVATQAYVDPGYGPRGLNLMRAGQTAADALAALVQADAASDIRQVAMVDAQGGVAAHTGATCIAAAGHHIGTGYSVQANMMLRDTVWPAMAAAYESASGDLAARMLAALDAAEHEGGDMRGKQSAALLIVGGPASDTPWASRIFDLRVDDHRAPLDELRRLVSASRANLHMRQAAQLLAAPEVDEPRLQQTRAEIAALEQHLGALQGNVEPIFWVAVGLAGAGLVDEALPLFSRVFAADPGWRELVVRLQPTGRLPQDPVAIARILGQ